MKKLLLILCLVSCSADKRKFEQTDNSVLAGSSVMLGKSKAKLYNEGGNLMVGKPIDKFIDTIAKVEDFKGVVSVINIVPSIDTKVCEVQSHELGETEILAKDIQRVSISRDLPMAQSRFAKEAKLENIKYYSDFKNARFGELSGLLMVESGLLARAVLVTDKEGIVQYMQLVPDIVLLPNMNKAFEFANNLNKK